MPPKDLNLTCSSTVCQPSRSHSPMRRGNTISHLIESLKNKTMADSDSSLSSLPSSDDEAPTGPVNYFGLDGANDAQRSTSLSPAPSSEESEDKNREPSPPHETVLADNPDIAVRVTRVNHVAADAIALWMPTARSETRFADLCRNTNSSSSCSDRASTTRSVRSWDTSGLKISSAVWWIQCLRRRWRACCVRFSASSSIARSQ